MTRRISKLKAVLDKNPKDSNALYIIGMAYLKKKMWAEAISSFLQVVDLSPKFPAAYYQLGDLLPAAERAAKSA